jgi:hypothetical protein
MTQQRDIERLLDHWLAEGSTVAPDRIADVVADRIERQFQRPAWLAERNAPMTPTFRIAAAVAAVAILGAGAVYLAGWSASPDVGGASPQPTLAPSPSAENSPARTTSSVVFQPALRIQLPAGWIVTDDARAFGMRTTAVASGPAGAIEFKPNPVIGSNVNDCEGLAEPGAGTSVAELVAALSSAPQFTVDPADPITLDGRAAQVLDIALAPDWTSTCSWSSGQPASLLFTVADPPGPFIGIMGSERLRTILLDLQDTVVVITVSPTDAVDFDEFLVGAMPVVESVTFTP